MKNLISKVSQIIAIVLIGVCFSGITASAFTNLSTTGGSTTGGGGSGATPSLSQVTAVGASTSDLVTFNGGATSTSVTSTKFSVGQGGSASDVRLQLGNGSTGLYAPNTSQLYFTAGGLDKFFIDSSNGLQPIGNIIPDNPSQRSVGTLTSPFAVGVFITASTTKLTVAGTLDANNITVSGTILGVGSIATQGQLSSGSASTAIFASGGGSVRAGNGTFDANVSDYNIGAKPTVGLDYETVTDRAFLRNGVQFLSLTSGSAATSSMNTQYFQFGLRNTSTVMYIGTADGCGRWTFATSNTSPTLTPVPVANCN